MIDLDCSRYLSLDNGKGLLLREDDAFILKEYGFDYMKYDNLNRLIFDIDSYLMEVGEECLELEEVVMRLMDYYYYHFAHK